MLTMRVALVRQLDCTYRIEVPRLHSRDRHAVGSGRLPSHQLFIARLHESLSALHRIAIGGGTHHTNYYAIFLDSHASTPFTGQARTTLWHPLHSVQKRSLLVGGGCTIPVMAS